MVFWHKLGGSSAQNSHGHGADIRAFTHCINRGRDREEFLVYSVLIHCQSILTWDREGDQSKVSLHCGKREVTKALWEASQSAKSSRIFLCSYGCPLAKTRPFLWLSSWCTLPKEPVSVLTSRWQWPQAWYSLSFWKWLYWWIQIMLHHMTSSGWPHQNMFCSTGRSWNKNFNLRIRS